MDDAYHKIIHQHANIIKHDPELFAGDELSEIFVVPPRKRHLHIIVLCPLPLKLSVWLVGSDPDRRPYVKVYDDETVEDLQRAIQKKYDDLENIDAKKLKLWMVSIIIPSRNSVRINLN